MGEAVFWLKPLYQLGFVRFFNFYFWIKILYLDWFIFYKWYN